MGNPIVDAIRAAGVVGAGGAGLPAHVKADATAQTVLVNGASCEPLLMSDPYLMETQVDTLVRGLETMPDERKPHRRTYGGRYLKMPSTPQNGQGKAPCP